MGFAPPAAPRCAVVVTDHPLLQLTNTAMVAAFAEERGLSAVGAPIIAAHRGLIGYGVDFPLMFRCAGVFVDKILKGGRTPVTSRSNKRRNSRRSSI
jgi:hypothetical protein